MTLDEPARQRPDWVEGAWATLADGQDWSLPVPRVVVHLYAFSAGLYPSPRYAVNGRPGPRFNEEYRAAIEAAAAAMRGTDLDGPGAEGRRLLVAAPLARVLLRENYRLSRAECDWLCHDGFAEAGQPPGGASRSWCPPWTWPSSGRPG